MGVSLKMLLTCAALPHPPTTIAITTTQNPLQALLRDVAAQDVQHDAAATAHGRVLDELVGLHTGRLEALHSQFEGDLQAVQAEFERCAVLCALAHWLAAGVG
jgi:hypothetical protein